MNDVSPMFLALKKQLKRKKVSYAELAGRLEMSEANVKRIFSEESCSLSRLGEICDVIGLSFADLMGASKNIEPDYFTLPKAAEDFFVDNLDYFVLFRQLENNVNLKVIQEDNGLSGTELNRYLNKLEAFGLVERMPGDRVRIKMKGYLSLAADSRLMSAYFKHWVPNFFQKVMRPSKNHLVKIFSTGLSEKNREELRRDLEDLCRKYRERGYIDQSRGTSAYEAVGVCIGVGPYRVGEERVGLYRGRK